MKAGMAGKFASMILQKINDKMVKALRKHQNKS